MDWAAPLVGFVVGVVVGLTSTGGGALLTPALVFVLGVPASAAVGTDVFVAAVMKLFGGGAYALRGRVHWPTVLRLAAGSVPGAMVGLWLLRLLPPDALDQALRRGLGAALLIAGGATLARLFARPSSAPRAPLGLRLALPLGFVVGVLVATTSVGSGSLLMAVLAPLSPLGAPTLVGTDLVHALVLSSTATLGHVAAGRVDFTLAAALLGGAIPGVILAARLAQTLPERALRASLAVLLIGIGLVLVGGFSPHARAATAQVKGAAA